MGSENPVVVGGSNKFVAGLTAAVLAFAPAAQAVAESTTPVIDRTADQGDAHAHIRAYIEKAPSTGSTVAKPGKAKLAAGTQVVYWPQNAKITFSYKTDAKSADPSQAQALGTYNETVEFINSWPSEKVRQQDAVERFDNGSGEWHKTLYVQGGATYKLRVELGADTDAAALAAHRMAPLAMAAPSPAMAAPMAAVVEAPKKKNVSTSSNPCTPDDNKLHFLRDSVTGAPVTTIVSSDDLAQEVQAKPGLSLADEINEDGSINRANLVPVGNAATDHKFNKETTCAVHFDTPGLAIVADGVDAAGGLYYNVKAGNAAGAEAKADQTQANAALVKANAQAALDAAKVSVVQQDADTRRIAAEAKAVAAAKGPEQINVSQVASPTMSQVASPTISQVASPTLAVSTPPTTVVNGDVVKGPKIEGDQIVGDKLTGNSKKCVTTVDSTAGAGNGGGAATQACSGGDLAASYAGQIVAKKDSAVSPGSASVAETHPITTGAQGATNVDSPDSTPKAGDFTPPKGAALDLSKRPYQIMGVRYQVQGLAI